MTETPPAPRTYRQHRFVRPDGACEIILVRHGESAPADPDDPFPLVGGQGDPPLFDPDGIEQARLTCTRLIESGERFGGVYVTPLRRTRETAELLCKYLGVEADVEPDLREVHLGDWEGGLYRKMMTEGDPVARQVFAEQRWDAIPNAEPTDAYRERVRGAIERLAARHRNETIAVFTHGGVIGEVVRQATDAQPLSFTGSDNCGITHIVVTADRWVMRTWNDTGHLEPRFTRDPDQGLI